MLVLVVLLSLGLNPDDPCPTTAMQCAAVAHEDCSDEGGTVMMEFLDRRHRGLNKVTCRYTCWDRIGSHVGPDSCTSSPPPAQPVECQIGCQDAPWCHCGCPTPCWTN